MDQNYYCKIRRFETTKGRTLQDRDISNSFLKMTPIAQEVRARIDKWNCIKIKRLVQQKK
jgi:hypothetical protein